MTRVQLLKFYDYVGDYWATWLGRASMLPETYQEYSDAGLRKAIALATGDWARSHWKYHDYARYEEQHKKFYREFFDRWEATVR